MNSPRYSRLKSIVTLFAAGCLLGGAAPTEAAVKDAPPSAASLIHPGQPWLDTDGQPIQAHSAGILFHNGVYYWYGENKSAPNDPPDAQGRQLDRVPVIGVSAYSSRDLVRWKNEGLVLKAVPDDPAHDLHPSKVCERPKVLFSARTKQFVMWWHMDTADYLAARAGVAVADRPTGPFRYLRSFRPINDQRYRDMNLLLADNGQAYVFYASEDNATLYVSRLNADFTDIERPAVENQTWRRNFPGAFREAPAPFQHAGRYYLITSGCTGWNPNAADLAIAEHPLGPYVSQGNPCVGPDADKTFGAQSTFVLPLPHQPGQFIFLADRWNPKNLRDSRYAWLPFSILPNQPVRIEWRDSWSPVLAPAAPASVTVRDALRQKPEWFLSTEGRQTVENVLSHQTLQGDWPKNLNTAGVNFVGDLANLKGTFDNGATTGELRLLTRAFNATKNEAARASVLKGLKHILRAQYPTGGWPQYSPPPARSYHRYITFNDDTVVRLMELLRDVATVDEFAFLDAETRKAAGKAFERGIECIVRCQVKANGKLKSWCAQHDEVTLEPRPGRSFELVSLSGAESAGLLKLLMSLDNPSAAVIASVHAGVAWFESVRLDGVREIVVEGDKKLVRDPSSPPMWARFYDIDTNRPIYSGRDGVRREHLADIEAERRNGYAWHGSWGVEVLKRYAEWKKRWPEREG